MIERITILQAIFGYFQYATQWVPNFYDNSAESIYKAEALIQLLEVEDCGHVGGFDKKNKKVTVTGFMLFDRYLTLIKKHHKESDINPICGNDIEFLKRYFIAIRELRQNKSDK